MPKNDADGAPLDPSPLAGAVRETSPTGSAPEGWAAALGGRAVLLTAERVILELEVGRTHLQPHGIVHGGVHTTLVETACSLGAQLAAGPAQVIVGVEQHTSFVRPARAGVIVATATPVHVGRRTQLWECAIRDAAGAVLATGQLRLMAAEQQGLTAAEQARGAAPAPGVGHAGAGR
jgi:1,4-dihydroxy-2-naphthoyl-CoA hydrolase